MKRLSVSLGLLVLFASTPVLAGDRYFVCVFSSQSVPLTPRYNHTFATVIKVTPDGVDPKKVRVDAVTISWLPATLEMRPLRMKPEPGVNLNLEDSIRVALCQGQRVSQWGPYETDAGLFAAAQCQAARLARGKLAYRALDPWRRNANFTDCIHAVLDLDSRLNRIYQPEAVMCGDRASARVVRDLISHGRIVNPQVTHDWLNAALGLESQPIRRVGPY